MAKKTKPNKGPKPDILKIEDDLNGSMRKALKKKKPKDGWPDAEKRKPPAK